MLTSLLVVELLGSNQNDRKQVSDWIRTLASVGRDRESSTNNRHSLQNVQASGRFPHLINLIQRLSRLGLLDNDAIDRDDVNLDSSSFYPEEIGYKAVMKNRLNLARQLHGSADQDDLLVDTFNLIPTKKSQVSKIKIMQMC